MNAYRTLDGLDRDVIGTLGEHRLWAISARQYREDALIYSEDAWESLRVALELYNER